MTERPSSTDGPSSILRWTTEPNSIGPTPRAATRASMHVLGEPWAFWVKDTKICVKLHASIATAARGQASLNYREKRRKYRQGAYSDIDWQAKGQAMSKVKITRRHWVSKHSSYFCGTSQMMHRWKQRATNLCPRCLTEGEDASHVWTCQDPRALTV